MLGSNNHFVPVPLESAHSPFAPPQMRQELQSVTHNDAVILVVEDTPELRQLLSEILQDAGYMVLTAENGRAALAVLAVQPVELILLDILMPELNGVATLSAIRAQSDVPVMMLSAVSNAILQAELTQLGVAAYMTKPFRLQALLDAITRILQGAPPARELVTVRSATPMIQTG